MMIENWSRQNRQANEQGMRDFLAVDTRPACPDGDPSCTCRTAEATDAARRSAPRALTMDEPSDGMSTAELAAELMAATKQRERIERAALSSAPPGTPEHEALRRSDCGGMLWCRCAVVSPHPRRTQTVLVDGKRIEESSVRPTRQTHDFHADHSGMVCDAMVERPDGTGDQCGEPVNSPVHDPAAYLAYDAELRTELKKWVAGEGEYDPREDLIHPFE
jgi:hypothetical protein